MAFIVSLFSNPAVLLGLVAQRKSSTEVMTGTFKTIIGFLVFGLGASAMSGALQNFNKLFQIGFNITGVVASPEAATALAQKEYGFVVSSVLILGFVMNLVFARFTKLKKHLLYWRTQFILCLCISVNFKILWIQ